MTFPGDPSEYLRGADGNPIMDRYGRPIRRRATTPSRPHQVMPPPVQQPSPQPGFQPAPQPGFQPAPQPGFAPLYVDPAAHPHRRAKKKHPIRTGLGCLATLVITIVITVVVLLVAVGLWADSRLAHSDAMEYAHVADTSGTNWLLVGSDSRAGMSPAQQQELGTGGEVGAGRTDTIMLLHIPSSGKAKLVSIPRDSYVEIPGFGMDKINAAFSYGGAPLLGKTIEKWSGLRIDRYAEIGMGGLTNVVNAVGGVDICVKNPINDPLAGINLAAGCQNLQGRNALGYVRTRATPLGDLDRVQRQREFFTTLLKKITSTPTLLNPLRVVSLVDHTAKSFVVGKNDHVWNLALLALAMSKGVDTQTVPLDGFADTAVGNVMLWNDAQTAALWNSLK